MKYTEIFKLKDMLEKAGIPFRFKNDFMDGYQLEYPAVGKRVCSVIEHSFSYGNEADLLEIMGLVDREDAVEGYLTAEEVFRRIQEHWMMREGNQA